MRASLAGAILLTALSLRASAQTAPAPAVAGRIPERAESATSPVLRASFTRRPTRSWKRKRRLESARHGESRRARRPRPIAGRAQGGRPVSAVGQGCLRRTPGEPPEKRPRIAVSAPGHPADDGDAVSVSDLSAERPRAVHLRRRRSRLENDLHRRAGHPKDPNPSFLGESVGHWEGDTLVVDAIGFNEATWLDQAGHPHTEALHITERFTRTNEATLHYEVTIDDPQVYTKPWTTSYTIPWAAGAELYRVHLPGEQHRSSPYGWQVMSVARGSGLVAR